MTHYLPRLIVTLAHDYYGDAPIPLRLVPSNPHLFDKQGFILRRHLNRFIIIGEEADDIPEKLSFDVIATTSDVFCVTRFAEWGQVLTLSMPPDETALAFGPATAPPGAMRNRMERIAQVDVFMSGTDLREVTVTFDAVEALWAYHVTGPGMSDDLQVIDPTASFSFSVQGRKRLPDGSEAQVIRSDAPLPARARPSQKFMLQRPSAFGPETLIPVLPAAGKSFKPIPEIAGNAARLQSDIYVTLW